MAKKQFKWTGSSRNTSIVSMAACYQWGLGFKSWQGRVISHKVELWYGIFNPFVGPSAGWAHTPLIEQGCRTIKTGVDASIIAALFIMPIEWTQLKLAQNRPKIICNKPCLSVCAGVYSSKVAYLHPGCFTGALTDQLPHLGRPCHWILQGLFSICNKNKILDSR